MSTRFIIGGIAALAVGLMIWAFWNHYEGILEENAAQERVIGQQELALSEQDATITAQREAIGRWDRAQEQFTTQLEELQRGQADARREVTRLREEFAEIDLTQLARDDPTAAGVAANRISDDGFRMLECATGSDRTDCAGADRGAESPDDPEADTD